jgi:hypothetical protein
LITDDLFEAFIDCELKAHLRKTGASGGPPEFVAWQRENLHRYREKCQLELRATGRDDECLPITSTLTDLRRSDIQLFFNCEVECDQFKTTIDAVERLSATSKQEFSLLVPIRFVPQNKVSRYDRLCLAFSAYVLSKATGTQCTLGKIIHGDGHATLRVKTMDHADTVRSIIAKLAGQQTSADPPALILNRHCPECEFRLSSPA